jgi:hypothetical protein
MDRERGKQYDFWGFHVWLNCNGIEVSRPKPLSEYIVVTFRWLYPPRLLIRRTGGTTYANG